ncbi:hypothetical protein [Bradyrhizobium ivorense]|uniref:hypothetical protein n=1 Tax=Bradyrhizobium ivorense TaxID=2511166 RepID=UPI0035583773
MLMQRGELWAATSYIAASMALSILALFAGYCWCGRLRRRAPFIPVRVLANLEGSTARLPAIAASRHVQRLGTISE